jgi:hypothetical protein
MLEFGTTMVRPWLASSCEPRRKGRLLLRILSVSMTARYPYSRDHQIRDQRKPRTYCLVGAEETDSVSGERGGTRSTADRATRFTQALHRVQELSCLASMRF